MSNQDIPEVFVYAPDGEWLMPYISREVCVGQRDAAVAVMISSAVDASGRYEALEYEFMSRSDLAASRRYVLRSAPIVGTGMNGPVRTLAEEIYRGVFFHFPGNEARKSIVHAVDVARAVRFLADNDIEPGKYNLSDGVDPTLHDIAEALAFRMGNKRISNLSTRPQQWIARLLYGRRRYNRYTIDSLVPSVELRALGFVPVDTCAYMRNHVYDSESL